jgi:alkanesulfonate monooxygenase SsuD/methylene tetrahydromethanopterin reductase-like flavin-dependent oxidoreductase (luciferase family)
LIGIQSTTTKACDAMVSFGLFCLMGYRDRGTSVSDVLGNAVQMVQWAEDAGFEAAWFAEHHFSNYCVCPSPLLMVNHCAGKTARIKLGPAVIVVPLYHPIRLLAEIGMTAALCGDRLLLGIGSGYQPFEFERYGADLAQSKAQLDEFLALMDQAYADETFAFDGTFTSVPDTSISTRPANGIPPIWIAGDSEATHRLAAQRGFVPIITGRAHGPDYLAEQRSRVDTSFAKEGVEQAPLGVLRFVCVTESDEETYDYLANARQQMRFAAALRNRQEAIDGGMLIEKPVPNEVSLDEMAENLAVGDAATIAERLIADIHASKASHVMLNVQAAGSTMVQAQRTIETFGREIRPMIDRALGTSR